MREALEQLGLTAEVSHESGTAIVQGALPDDKTLSGAVEQAGYKVVSIE